MKMLKVLLAIILATTLISDPASALDHPARPANARLIEESVLVCNEEVLFQSLWDTDDNVSNGYERAEIALLNNRIVYIALFTPDLGELVLYSVTTPGGVKWYFDLASLAADYPSPCDVAAEMSKVAS